ncbi:MAG: helix-turn-helix transcriptional regulator [Myxococcales bacterium]|nr:helix-turn-helix transcriptional regulator [Myxococcales bacterium]
MPRRPGTASLARRIGARIRSLRVETGITQEKLAWNCNLAKPYLSQIEAGKRLPSLPALVALAKQLGVELADLILTEGKDPRFRFAEAARCGDWQSAIDALRELGFACTSRESRARSG